MESLQLRLGMSLPRPATFDSSDTSMAYILLLHIADILSELIFSCSEQNAVRTDVQFIPNPTAHGLVCED
jgi:hypothetical protein